MKKFILGIIASAPMLLQAEDCCMPEYIPDEPLCDGCAGYSQYAGIQLDCGWDMYAFGEFLYWKPYRSTTYVAENLPPNPFTPPVAPQFMRSPSLGYRPAFRVGIGMVAHCFDDWVFSIDYTRYHHGFSNTYSAVAPGSITSTLISLPQFQFLYSSIKNRSHFHYDIVGLDIRRPNYLGRRVVVNPFFGLKWLRRNVMIGQDLIGFTGLVDAAETTLKYTSIGLNGGMDGSVLLYWGFRLIGNADVALLYAYNRDLSVVATPANVIPFASPIFKETMHFRHLDVYARGGLGLGWGSYFSCNRYHVDLAVTYDWMGDISKLDFLNGTMMPNGSVVLMGLTVRGQFDF